MESKHEIPTLFVLGTTATGKSALAIDLAERFNGEIINSDSMCIYTGNAEGWMVAKASQEEQARVPHHCLDFLDIETTDFNV